MKNLIIFLLFVCVVFAQDDKKVNQGRQGSTSKSYEPAPRMKSHTNWSHLSQRELVKVKYSWDEENGTYKVEYEYSDNRVKRINPTELTCEKMLELTWIEPDSIMHNCPEHNNVMIYKCPECGATSLEKVHKCGKMK